MIGFSGIEASCLDLSQDYDNLMTKQKRFQKMLGKVFNYTYFSSPVYYICLTFK